MEIDTFEQRVRSRRYYRLIGIMLFSVASGLLAVRTLTSLVGEHFSEIGLDAFFSMILQIGVLVIMPILFYIFAFKMKPREILEFTSIRKTKPINYVLAVLIGLFGIFVTMGISTVWQSIIGALGYTHSTSDSTLPNQFNPAIFLLSLFLSAVLPGFCEEFTMRGGYFTTMRSHFSFGKVLLIMGISFGLFHQYITQVFYTALFGAIMAALLYKCKSIIPCMIVHFVNNGTSVYLESAGKYGWFGKNFYNNLNDMIVNSPLALFGSYLLITVAFIGVVALFFYINKPTPEEIRSQASMKSAPDIFDRMSKTSQTTSNYEVQASTEQNNETINSQITQPTQFETLPKFKPTLRDNVFYIGAAVMAILTTIFTFYWGWMT